MDLALFTLAAGEVVTFDTDAADAGFSRLDTALRIFDAAGEELAINDDSDGLDSLIAFTAPADGVYGVGVSSYANVGYDPTVEGSGDGGFFTTSFGRWLGDDRLFAGGGESRLIGGPGADRFRVATAALPDGVNTIADFAAGEDLIGFGGLGTPELVLEEQPPVGTLLSIEIDAGIVPIATILGVLPDQLGAADFLFA